MNIPLLQTRPVDTNPPRRWPCGLTRNSLAFTAIALAFAGSTCADAGLVLEVKPTDYNASTKQWPIANGSILPSGPGSDYFACAAWAPVSLTTKVNAGDGLSYSAVDFTAAGTILGGPLCPASLGGANPKTIETWCFQPTGANGDAMTLIDLSRQYGADNTNFAFVNSMYNRSIWAQGYVEGWNASNAVRSGNWVHLVASYDGTTLNLFVNGAPDKTGIAHTFATEAGGSISIGMMRYAFDGTPHSTNNADGWNAYRGYLGSIRVYDEARTADQVSADYALGVNYGEVGAGLPKITASVSGSGGSISPGGVTYVAAAGSQTYTFSTDLGFKVADVLVDDVSTPAAVTAGSYTFTGVVADHTIVVSFAELPKQTVSGKVTDGTAGVMGATVYFKTSANASISPTFTTTTVDAAGNYSIILPPGGWYMTATEVHYLVPADSTFTVDASPVVLPDIVFTADPNWQLVFTAYSSDVPSSGAWPCAYPVGASLSRTGLPTVTTTGGQQFERNAYASGDGWLFGHYNSPIPCAGATIVAVVSPTRNADSWWSSVVNLFYNDLMLNVRNSDGLVQVVLKGNWYNGPTLPEGVPAIIAAVVQPAGGVTIYVNGVQAMSVASPAYTAMTPGGWNGDGSFNGTAGYAHGINVGRNDPDGWTTYNGDLGDIHVYKTAISDADRTTLQNSLATKFNIALSSTVVDYATWAATKYPGAELSNPAADLDGDGMSNFQEYAFGLNPTLGTSANPIAVPLDKSHGTFSYTRTANSGLTYTVWHSTNLLDWASTGATAGTVTTVDGVETVPVTLDSALLTEPALFVRVAAQ